MTDSQRSQQLLFANSIVSSIINVSVDYSESIDKKFQTIFTLVNYNYLVNDSINDIILLDEKLWIIYQVKNCLIDRPIGWIEGAIKIEPLNDDDNIEKNRSNSLIILRLNPQNGQQMSDFRRMRTNANKVFQFSVDSYHQNENGQKLIINSMLNPNKNFILDTDGKMFVHLKTFKIIENDDNALTINKPVTIEIQTGCIDLFFSPDDSFYICRPLSDQELRFKIISTNYQIDYVNNNKEEPYDRNESHVLSIEKKISSKPCISLPERIKRKNLIQLAEIKRTLLSSSSPSSSSFMANLQSKTTNNEFNDNKENEVIKSESKSFETVKDFSVSNNETEKSLNCDVQQQPSDQKMETMIQTKKSPEIRPEDKEEQQPKTEILDSTKPQSQITKVFSNFEKTKVKSLDEIGKIMKLDSVLIVNKINLNKLAASPVVISPEPSTITDQSLRSLSKSATEPRKTLTSIKDRKILRKAALHDIQKTVRYLEYVNAFVANNEDNFKDEAIKCKFDSYRDRLARQLMHTIDRIDEDHGLFGGN
ncbi:hypothetical protein DERP_007585 [Dermatophagoides pteronyssinus]|uniref:Uncharacterized protein n=1 Tax=Dermatophagoides pteronyssinus TaxID=6956 RepID=A0ABQ8JK60_DERPT|nr:hypothetical protein DERP_007585 [Dermatophagoides pteronyssinus]